MKKVLLLTITFIFCFSFAQDIIIESGIGGKNYSWYKEIIGSWLDSTSKSKAPGVTSGIRSRFSEYHSGKPFASKAIITPIFPESGVYEVFVTWGRSANLVNVKYVINHANGTSVVYLDQDGWGALGSPNCDKWISLGKYSFQKGAGNNIIIDGSEAKGPAHKKASARLYVDAFKFSYVGSDTSISQSSVKKTVEKPSYENSPTFPKRVKSFSGNTIEWLSDLEKAMNIASSTGKNILIYFYAPVATWCQKYDEYFKSPEFTSVLSNYVLVKIDIVQNKELFREFKIYRVPSIIITNSNGFEVKRITKILDKTKLLDRLR